MNYDVSRERIEAFKEAILNTCIRIARNVVGMQDVKLSNCLSNKYFCAGAYQCLSMSLFNPIEPAMAEARIELKHQLLSLRSVA